MTSSIWYTASQSELPEWSPFQDVQTQVESHGTSSIGEVMDVSCGFIPPEQLHILARTDSSRVWYTFGFPVGYPPYAFWPTAFVDMEQQTPGIGPYADPANSVTDASCAGSPSGVVQVTVVDYLLQKVWHTVRYSIGQWWGQYQDVTTLTRANLSPAQLHNARFRHPAFRVASAVNPTSRDLHVLLVDVNEALFHTIRLGAGSAMNWTFPFGEIPAQVGKVAQVSCACNSSGDLHVIVIDSAGRLSHTIRLADGSWPYPFGQVATIPAGTITTASCATDSKGQLHVVAFDSSSSKLWRTTRDAGGGWSISEDMFTQTGAIPNAGIGRTVRSISCAADPADNLHVFVANGFIFPQP